MNLAETLPELIEEKSEVSKTVREIVALTLYYSLKRESVKNSDNIQYTLNRDNLKRVEKLCKEKAGQFNGEVKKLRETVKEKLVKWCKEKEL